MENMYHRYLIDKQVNRFLCNKFSQNYNEIKETKNALYYKLH